MANSLVALRLVGFAYAVCDLESVGLPMDRESIVKNLKQYIKEYEQEKTLNETPNTTAH